MRSVVLLLFCLGLLVLHAETYIADGTEVSGTWSAQGSPYILEREAVVPPGTSLVIEPGVSIKLNPSNSELQRGRLVVRGTLQAVGTQAQPVEFTRQETGPFWGAITFEDTFSENNQLIHCVFTDAARYPEDGENVYGAVAAYESHVYISHCEFVNNGHYGVAVRDGSQVYIEDCWIHGNTWSGVYVRDEAEVYLYNTTLDTNSDFGLYIRGESMAHATSCTFEDNGQHGVYVREDSSVDLTDCILAENHLRGALAETGASIELRQCIINDNYYGVYCHDADLVIVDCTVSNNVFYGVFNRGNYDAQIRDCDIFGNGNKGVYTEFASNAYIVNNTIHGNDSGIYSGEEGVPYIVGNDIYDNLHEGVTTYRATTFIENNYIHHNGDEGIYFYRWEDGCSVGNLLYQNGQNGDASELHVYHNSNVTITNTTIVNDEERYPVLCGLDSSVIITNCIFSVPETLAAYDDAEITTAYTCLTDSLPQEFDNGHNMPNTDPMFLAEDNFRLQEDSPCIDAGHPNMGFFTLPPTDLDGFPRIWPQRIDMGAYEAYTDLPPVIEGWEPMEQNLQLDEGERVTFTVHTSDWESLNFDWQLDGVSTGAADSTLTLVFDEPGFFVVEVLVDDGEYTARTRWTLQVALSAGDQPQLPDLALVPGVNPGRVPVRLSYSLPSCTDVHIEVYDIRGRQVRQWQESGQTAGVYGVLWDGCDKHGRPVASGVYLVRLSTALGQRHGRITLFR